MRLCLNVFILTQFVPSVKSVTGNFLGIGLIGFELTQRINTEILDKKPQNEIANIIR